MTIAFWTLLAAIAFPWLMAVIKKSALASNGTINNSALEQAWKIFRVSAKGLCGRRKIVLKFSLPTLQQSLLRIWQGLCKPICDLIAILFIASRALYALCYLMNWATLRSIVWTLGLICIVSLFIISV